MSSLTVSNIQKSVAKVTDIMDVNLNDINDKYLVDNFKPPSLLRNTVLRSEFNTLCKGKTESKALQESDTKVNLKIYLCKEEQIRDIPSILCPLFENVKKYYIFGTPSNYSFLYSLLYILNNDFVLDGKLQKEKKLDEIRNTLVYNLEDYYRNNNYKAKKFKKSVIRENILNSKIFLPQTIHYILDYFKSCLLIIDTETYLYSLGNDYREDKNIIIMLRKNNYYQPIMNSEGNNTFTKELIMKISTILKPEFEINLDPVVEEEEESKPFDGNLLKESKYKVGDLQKIAQEYNISIKIDGSNRNKKKSDLYKEISEKLSH
jgi:hypothetical protein